MFNEQGYRTLSLSGSDSDEVRDKAIADLESGRVEYLFTVNIFNEGIDIPSLNQIIMLRRTESPIVFVQQLGRGLRKANGKEYALVLDFIGNYQQNYLVPMALSGDRTYSKDNLRAFVKEGSTILPGCSTISFDEISEKRIFKAVDAGRFSDAALIKGEYSHLKNMLGRIPSLSDFDKNESIDPLIIFGKYGSYPGFLMRYESDFEGRFTAEQLDMLKFISQKMGNGKRSEDLQLLRKLIESRTVELDDLLLSARGDESDPESVRFMREETMRSVAAFLSGKFSSSSSHPLIGLSGGLCSLGSRFAHALVDPVFRAQVLDVIDFGLARHEKLYKEKYRETSLTLYAKYTYEEVCKLLNWEKNINGQNIGGYKYDAKTNTFPVFINYDKDPDIDAAIRYEDRFVSDRELVAISKQPRTMASPEIQRLEGCPENGMRVYLFMRKDKNDGDGGKEFYFLGEMYPTGFFNPIVMPGTTKTAVEIGYRLDRPVRGDIYDYLTSTFKE
ncbi:MAG: DUF3427 domain-containing protein [Eggerthellaceae bacterium]